MQSAVVPAAIFRLNNVCVERRSTGMSFRLEIPALSIHPGEKIALIGESGCGKSTLLDLLAFVARPDTADLFHFQPSSVAAPVLVDRFWRKRRLNRLGDLRKQYIGYVMQTGGLLPFLSVRDNILLSRRILRLPDDGYVDHLVSDLGLTRHLDKLPTMLSVGERQRIAIGRALAHQPSIVIADEPTASVDPFAAEKIMKLFIDLAEARHITVIIASHAWRHIKRLGLRRLAHHSSRSADGLTTTTVVNG